MKMRSRIGLYLLLTSLVSSLGVLNASAFSLLGPYESWMTRSNGFLESFAIGGPKNLGEEYRWNVPTVTYAFDQSFLDSFGSNGVAAVESAIQILNDLPPASQMDPGTYPLDSRGENAAAQAQELIDLKSETLFLLLQQLGLARPQRFMFCVHDFSITAETTNVTVVLRNFDPFSFAATNVLNGTLYTNFIVIQLPMGPQLESVNVDAVPVDPLNSDYTAVADDWTGMSAGSFYTGLTRDDVGGLRYLLQTNNYNLEPLLPDVHGAGTNSSNYVNFALRGGVDKITFVREMVDPITGEFFSPVTDQYTDTYVTNEVLMQQQLERVTTRPDFIFTAYDGADGVSLVEVTGTTNWLNNALPGVGGPGTIRPQVKIAFSKFGFSGAVGTSDLDDAFQVNIRRWASFDASTNPPVIYPTGATTGAGNPWAVRLSLINTDSLPLRGGYFIWHLPVSLGTAVRLETSTDLVNWTALTTVTNCGVSLLWEHRYSKSSGYFRAAPQ